MSRSAVVVVGIPTFKRPEGLRRLLESIGNVSGASHVLVADNEGHGAGHRVVDDLRASGFPLALHVIPVEEPGLAAVRNALMSEAFDRMGADFLAMVDDDQRVDVDWLDRLVEMQRDTASDLVGGSVVPEFEVPPPEWASGLPIYWREQRESGITQMLHGTGNILVARSARDKFKAAFDRRFSFTGGEDKELFVRLKAQGAVFSFAPGAIAWEWIDRPRMSRRWVIKRAFRIGSCEMLIHRLHHRSAKEWGREALLIVGGLMCGPCLMVIGVGSPGKFMRGLLMVVRQLGKLAGLLGRAPVGYGEGAIQTSGA